MNVYEEDSDHFSKEYLDYLGTLSFEVTSDGTSRQRITKNPAGEIVRIETWDVESFDRCTSQYVYGYRDVHLAGWMRP